jgi:hypothetical protein
MKAGLVEARKLRFNRRADAALSARRRILLGTVVLRRIQMMQYGELIRGMHRGLLNHISFVFPAGSHPCHGTGLRGCDKIFAAI